jgi:hypothetical protein
VGHRTVTAPRGARRGRSPRDATGPGYRAAPETADGAGAG